MLQYSFFLKGPSTLATLFNHMWPRIVADPSTLGRHVCYVCKRSVCGGDEPQPVAHLSYKLQCARQSLKIMVSYGNKYPRHNARPHVVEQSGQCARALNLEPSYFHSPYWMSYSPVAAYALRSSLQGWNIKLEGKFSTFPHF